jgi:hypothetical protein
MTFFPRPASYHPPSVARTAFRIKVAEAPFGIESNVRALSMHRGPSKVTSLLTTVGLELRGRHADRVCEPPRSSASGSNPG